METFWDLTLWGNDWTNSRAFSVNPRFGPNQFLSFWPVFGLIGQSWIWSFPSKFLGLTKLQAEIMKECGFPVYVALFTLLRPIYKWMALSLVGWTFIQNNQSRKFSHNSLMINLMDVFSQLKFPLTRWLKLASNWQTQAVWAKCVLFVLIKDKNNEGLIINIWLDFNMN